MAGTVNKVYSISRAKGRGDYRLVHVTFEDWGVAGTGRYTTGGVEVTIPDAKEVISPVNVYTTSGGLNLAAVSYSGAAIKLIAWGGAASGEAQAEVKSGLATSGVIAVHVAAIVEQT